LEWERFLLHRGASVAAAQANIASAYNKPWRTIHGWRSQVDEVIGNTVVDFMLTMAGAGAHGRFLGLISTEDVSSALAADAAAYAAEERSRAKGPPVRRHSRKKGAAKG
jgi:hypothetical protein